MLLVLLWKVSCSPWDAHFIEQFSAQSLWCVSIGLFIYNRISFLRWKVTKEGKQLSQFFSAGAVNAQCPYDIFNEFPGLCDNATNTHICHLEIGVFLLILSLDANILCPS